MEWVTVYTTAGDRDEAVRIAGTLVDSRLVACVNIFNGEMASVYRWQGQVETAHEIGLMAKTRRSLFEQVASTIRSCHSYETPCIVAWPIVEVDDAYASWLAGETAPESS